MIERDNLTSPGDFCIRKNEPLNDGTPRVAKGYRPRVMLAYKKPFQAGEIGHLPYMDRLRSSIFVGPVFPDRAGALAWCEKIIEARQ